MKKKVLSLILVCAMFAALAVPAMAADTVALGNYPLISEYCCDVEPCEVRPITFAPTVIKDICITVPCNWTVELIALYFYGTDDSKVVTALREINLAHFLATGGMLEAGRGFTLPSNVAGVTRIRGGFLPAGTVLAEKNNVFAITGDNAVFYWVQPGDTFTKIVTMHYRGLPVSLIMPFVFQANKTLNFMTNINKLEAGQVIYLPLICVQAPVNVLPRDAWYDCPGDVFCDTSVALGEKSEAIDTYKIP
jgi:hypothetical protein